MVYTDNRSKKRNGQADIRNNMSILFISLEKLTSGIVVNLTIFMNNNS